ncbi:MAG: AAA family ATPase [Burkholderiales bacterium]|nr:AAA family ATPase [Burkholderiales bacterium]
MNDAANNGSLPVLISALRDPGCYPHPVAQIDILETHISWVVLTGSYAYKIKKPVDLGFLDFTTLEKRAHYCREELRLNRRLAPALYLGVVVIGGSPEHPRVGSGKAIEYAVRMTQFEQEQLASRLLVGGKLTPQHIEQLAQKIAAFHQQAPSVKSGSRFGTLPCISSQALQNFDQIAGLADAAADRAELVQLRAWTEHELAACSDSFASRLASGRVRECHGDLHLGNIALLDGALTPFDCIEFNDALRCIDVASEVAFLTMDLLDRGRPDYAFLFLNGCLEAGGDYGAMGVLRFYLVYRAMVRAKVHCLRAHQPHIGDAEHRRLLAAYRGYLDLANQFTRRRTPALIIMHGLSGSGKSTLSQALLQAAGAIRIRSDVERKRLHGVPMLEHTANEVDAGIYSETITQQVYGHLARLAREVIASGYPVIIDGAFLKRWQRELMRDLARELGSPFVIAGLKAPESVLSQRIACRSGGGRDASDAGLAVLSRQIPTHDPIADDERTCTIMLSAELPLAEITATPEWRVLLERLA